MYPTRRDEIRRQGEHVDSKSCFLDNDVVVGFRGMSLSDSSITELLK